MAKEIGFVGIYPTTEYIPMYVEVETNIFELTEQQGEDDEQGNFYLAVTQSVLQTWLRNKHNIHCHIGFLPNKKMFDCFSYSMNLNGLGYIQAHNKYRACNSKVYDTYEAALEDGFRQALKLIKNNSHETN